ncbi:hypothetical protein N7532_003036 [Penicillium argentinense]|uniref:Hemerythrin-like domain-containing protein n=1 Tax=Penicillium argentinense TaxID=1131581 RepID=A0A9W9FLR2_9EURO|nr:uncharacterized protein N7532_003036 [Penicillium argentinense]KAJ5102507.1 hypothetical protein N7532_003036 [Penicillium argentinense]
MERISRSICVDHRQLALTYRQLVDAADDDELTRYQNQLTWQLARHVVGEEVVLFPALDQHLRDGDAAGDRHQHRTHRVLCADPSASLVP